MTDTQPILERIDKTPQTLRDIVQERMRSAILEGHFAPGARLVERPLCDQLGVSRTVIRETIRFLEAEGLVEVLPNRGPIVATFDWDMARQIYDIRRQLESSAAAACAGAHRPDFGPRLTDALNALARTMDDTTWTELLKRSTHFYELIFTEAGHGIAWDIVQRLNGRISRLRALTLPDKSRARPGIAHMTAIHDAILARDPEAARAAVTAHIEDAARTARRILAREDEYNAPTKEAPT